MRPFIGLSAAKGHGGEYDAHEIADDEADAIYRLAEQDFNEHEEYQQGSNDINSVTPQPTRQVCPAVGARKHRRARVAGEEHRFVRGRGGQVGGAAVGFVL